MTDSRSMSKLALTIAVIALAVPGAAQARSCTLGALPDKACTPGAAHTTDQHAVCPTWKNRPVSAKLRAKVLRAYRIPKRRQSRYLVSPLIAFSLGGSNSQANLFPQSRANAAKLAKLSKTLHASVCNGDIGLDQAQAGVTDDWVSLYGRIFG